MLRLLATIAVIVAILWVLSSLALPEAVPRIAGSDITPLDAPAPVAAKIEGKATASKTTKPKDDDARQPERAHKDDAKEHDKRKKRKGRF